MLRVHTSRCMQPTLAALHHISAHGTSFTERGPLHEACPTRADAADALRGRLHYVTPSCVVCAGQHGFSGGKSGTVLLGPGVHDIRIDYFQVPAASPVAPIRHKAQYQDLRMALWSSCVFHVRPPPRSNACVGLTSWSAAHARFHMLSIMR